MLSSAAEAPTGRAVLAYAPLYPYPKEEKWTFVVADQGANTVYARAEVSLIEAETAGLGAAKAAAERRRPQPLLLTGAAQTVQGRNAAEAVR